MISKSHLIAFFLILTAAFIRFYGLQSFAGFDFDQETAVTIASRIISGDLTLIGQEISLGGIFIGPFYNYIIAIPLFLSSGDPAIIFYFQAFLGVLTAYILYQTSQHLQPRSGFITLLLYTFSFYFIYNDKTATPSNWLPFLTAVSLFVSHKSSLSPKNQIILTSLLSGFATQLHPAGISLVSIPVFLLFTHRRQLTPTLPFIAALCFLINFTPLILFDLRNNFLNLKGLLAASPPSAYPLVFRALSRIHFTFDTFLATFTTQRNLSLGIILSFIIFHSRHKLKHPLLLTLALTGPIIFTLYPGSIIDYYILPSAVAFFLLASQSLYHFSQINFSTKLATITWIIVFLVGNTHVLLTTQTNHSLTTKKEVVTYIKNHTDDNQIAINFDTDLGQNHGFTYLFSWQNLSTTVNGPNPDFVIYIPANRGEGGITFDSIRLVPQ